MPNKEYYWTHRDQCLNEGKEYYKNNKGKAHQNYIKRQQAIRKCKLLEKYGITLKDYDRMFKKQNGLCAICNRPEGRQRNGTRFNLSIDHCHNTGQVRKLLCAGCNSKLGWYETWINQIESYLKNN